MTHKQQQSPDKHLGEARLYSTELQQRPTRESLVVVIARHNFERGCLSSWIQMFCTGYRLATFPDTSSPELPAVVETAALAVLSALGGSHDEGWAEREIIQLRALRPSLPIVAIVDEGEPNTMTENVLRLALEGYIPTTSTMEVAAAVLHLVVAGGTYIPHLPDHAGPLPSPRPYETGKSIGRNDAKLTPRESKVLDLLAQGMSNKTIAYRLSLSESTVKVHVHRIISKFKVHNRTEAVVSAYHLQVQGGVRQLSRVQAPRWGAKAIAMRAPAEVAVVTTAGTAQIGGESSPLDSAMG